MTDLTPSIFERIFFAHIKRLTQSTPEDALKQRMSSFDYQFSDHWLGQHMQKR